MAKKFNKTPKSGSKITVRNNRSNLHPPKKKEEKEKKTENPFEIVWKKPLCMDLCPIRAMLSCEVTLDSKIRKRILLVPCRRNLIIRIKMAFNVEEFSLAEVEVVKMDGKAL